MKQTSYSTLSHTRSSDVELWERRCDVFLSSEQDFNSFLLHEWDSAVFVLP